MIHIQIHMISSTFSGALSMVPHHGSALPALAWVESNRCNLGAKVMPGRAKSRVTKARTLDINTSLVGTAVVSQRR